MRSNLLLPLFFGFVMIASIAGLVYEEHHPRDTKPSYEGSKAVLAQPSQTVTLQIDQAVLRMQSTLPKGVQADIHINKFVGKAAQGNVSYTSKFAPQQFLVVETEADTWKVIDHTTSKKLPLPNDTTAAEYKLPLGWYSN